MTGEIVAVVVERTDFDGTALEQAEDIAIAMVAFERGGFDVVLLSPKTGVKLTRPRSTPWWKRERSTT